MMHWDIAQKLVRREFMGDLWCWGEGVNLKLDDFKTTRKKNACCLESIT